MSATADARPVLFVVGHAPADRIGAFARLSELEHVQFALFGGRLHHGVPVAEAAEATAALPFPTVNIRQRELFGLVRTGRYRAVICASGGRIALPASWAAARASRTPLILWASLWAHPLSPAHLFSYLPLRRLYRSADAVVTYGPHVSAYVRRRGARNVHVAPQAVDNAFWAADASAEAPPTGWPEADRAVFIFVGRPVPEKGLMLLLSAWRSLDLPPRSAALVLVGAGTYRHPQGLVPADEEKLPQFATVHGFGVQSAVSLRNFYSRSDVLVIPSIRTPMFREPWGLVVNEAFNQGVPVIASDAVGAAAGGLIVNERNGLIVPAGDRRALAGAIERLAGDPQLRLRLGAQARADVAAYTYDAWAGGFSAALSSIGRSVAQSGGVDDNVA